MEKGMKVLIGVGVYFAVAIIACLIIFGIDEKKNAKKVAEAEAQSAITETEAAYNSELKTFIGYAMGAAKKNTRVERASAIPDSDRCEVEADIGGYVYSFSDDGADADGAVAAACLYGLDCSAEIFAAEKDVERISFVFRVKDKMNSWNEAVSFVVDRGNFEKINYENFRAQVNSDYNAMWKIVKVLTFGGIEERLKKFNRATAVENNALYR